MNNHSSRIVRADDAYRYSIGLDPSLRWAIEAFESKLFFHLYPEYAGQVNIRDIYDFKRLNKQEYTRKVSEFLDSDHEAVRTLRQKYIEAGFAYPLFYPDWDVDRPDETQAKYSGTKPHAEIIQFLTSEHLKSHGKRKLRGLNLGPGNGYGMYELQKSQLPASERVLRGGQVLRDTTTVSEHWDFVGLCDKIYFPLSLLLMKFWKGDVGVGKEVCQFLTVQTLFEINSWRSKNKGLLHPLQRDIRILPAYLREHFPSFLGRLSGESYTASDEFENDSKEIKLSDKARAFLSEYLESRKDFVAEAFSEDFHDEVILQKAPFYFRNIYIGKFDQLKDIFPKQHGFDFISSIRGTSHIDNEEYRGVIFESALRLSPGGILIDDGVRRSYSREIRIREIQSLVSELGEEYQAHIIRDSSGKPLSIVIERGRESEDGAMTFYDPTVYENRIVGDSHVIQKIERGATVWQVSDITRRIISTVMTQALSIRRGDPAYFKLLQNLKPVHDMLEREVTNLETGNIGISISSFRRQVRGLLCQTISHIERIYGEDISHS